MKRGRYPPPACQVGKQPRAVIPEQAEAAAPSIKPPAAPMESPRPQTKPQGTNAEPEGCGEEPAAEAADMPQEQEPPEDKKGPVDMEALQQGAKRMTDWPEVLEYLKDYSHVIASAFHGSVAYVNGDFVLIDAPNSMAFELLRKSAQRDKMRIAIKEITGRTYKLGPYRREYQEKKTGEGSFGAVSGGGGKCRRFGDKKGLISHCRKDKIEMRNPK